MRACIAITAHRSNLSSLQY